MEAAWRTNRRWSVPPVCLRAGVGAPTNCRTPRARIPLKNGEGAIRKSPAQLSDPPFSVPSFERDTAHPSFTPRIISHNGEPNNVRPSISWRGGPRGRAAFSRVMKEVLLRISAMLSKVGLTKGAELSRGHFLLVGKVFLPQDALDPDIDWKRAKPLVSKEHHTISNLCAHPGQLAEAGP